MQSSTNTLGWVAGQALPEIPLLMFSAQRSYIRSRRQELRFRSVPDNEDGG